MSEVLDRAQTWVPPAVDGPVVGKPRRIGELDAIEREAWDAGFGAGREAGLAAVRREQQAQLAELDQRLRHWAQILDLLARPLRELDEQVERQLALLAGAIARQVVRREIRTQPDQIIAVIRATVALLPMATRDVRVHLHPDDARLVRERLQEPGGDCAWAIVEDPVLSPGGCRVTTENSTIDARIEQRLGAAIAAVLGDERARGEDGGTA
ncbi:MAG: flagellar assembly protein FliH [Gammaproteobacteria bacterium]|nr:flagellar assembly protein FliH [Gammaproteobacteria bacterium]